MKSRIEFTGTLDVYDDEESGEMRPEDARNWVCHALERGDKHASSYVSWLGQVTSVSRVEDDD